MTFQEILEGITRHRAHRATVSDPEIQRKFEEIEWALQALAETLRDREQQLEAVAPREVPWDDEDTNNEVDEAFDEYEKRK